MGGLLPWFLRGQLWCSLGGRMRRLLPRFLGGRLRRLLSWFLGGRLWCCLLLWLYAGETVSWVETGLGQRHGRVNIRRSTSPVRVGREESRQTVEQRRQLNVTTAPPCRCIRLVLLWTTGLLAIIIRTKPLLTHLTAGRKLTSFWKLALVRTDRLLDSACGPSLVWILRWADTVWSQWRDWNAWIHRRIFWRQSWGRPGS